MKKISAALMSLLIILASCGKESTSRQTIDFNFNWKFAKGDFSNGYNINFDDSKWEEIKVPHDWSIKTSYQKENTAASTGFVEGGIGWYRKSFNIPESDKGKVIWVEFDGVYCNSEVWINGNHLGFRPNGYSSFSYDLTKYLNYGDKPNIISVKVDHSAYVDTRWYTGSGIYRNVRLVKTSPTYIPQWGVHITTEKVSASSADIIVKTEVSGKMDKPVEVEVSLIDNKGKIVATQNVTSKEGDIFEAKINLNNPKLWSLEHPNLYTAQTTVKYDGNKVDMASSVFGVRSFRFDPEKGFFLNGVHAKLKGVNLHHDAGALGAAVPYAAWEYRIKQLKSVGVNAVRMSHNPHSPELMDICDKMGMLVMDEFFDEWHVPKGKSVVYLGDNAAGKDISKGYSTYFHKWAERDLKDLIKRDFNHPSVIMWSIGNEIEWTFPKYSKVYSKLNPKIRAYVDEPIFETDKVLPVFEELTGGVDSLSIVATQLSKWVKEADTTRPVTCGSVRPSVSLSTGYGKAVDILGFNYRATTYDIAHKTFPNEVILGSENWGSYAEWKSCLDRDFVSGIFIWTGFAYMGEAGPWPRKGLNLSLFDFAGFKTPRGHFFECMWKDDPKVYMVTTPAKDSEYAYSAKEGWKFEMQLTPPPVWNQLRRWEWYKVNEHWNYKKGEDIIVQTYTNCEEAELFLNGKSLGKQALADFKEDNIIKWSVAFQKGELKVKGYNDGKEVEEYILNSTTELDRIELYTDKKNLNADTYDLAHVAVKLYDKNGHLISDLDKEIQFEVNGQAELLAVDNGWEMNVENHYQQKVKTHNGKALAVIQASNKSGMVEVSATIGNVQSKPITLEIKDKAISLSSMK